MVERVARRALRLVVLFTVVGVAGGCAGYKIQEGGTGCGYDVYAPEPYLKATPKMVKNVDDKDVWLYEFTLIWLPNYSKRYRVSSWAGLGKAEFTFKFTDGWQLVSIEDKADNTKITEALTTLAGQVLPKNPAATFDTTGKKPDPKGVEPPGVILYRIDFDSDGRPACLKALDVGETSCAGTGSYALQRPCR